MLFCFKYCVSAKDQRFVMETDKKWNGNARYFLFQISGKSYSAFVSCSKT